MTNSNRPPAVIVAPVFVNGVAVMREMARKGAHVVAVDSSKNSPGLYSRSAHEKVVLPSPITHEGELARFLLARKDLYGGLVIPTDDFYVRELYKHRDDLADKYRLCISKGDAVEVALDKDRSAQAAEKAGVETPRTRHISREMDLEDALEYVGFPAIVKPMFSVSFYRTFGVKAFRVTTKHEMIEAFRKARSASEEVVLQEVIPGGDDRMFKHVAYWDGQGNCAGEFCLQKLLQYPPIFGVGQIMEVIKDSTLPVLSRKIFNQIGFGGSIAVSEWKYDERDGRFKFIEVNPRSYMQISIARPAGVDILEMMWRDKLGIPGKVDCSRVHYGLKWAYLKNGLLRHKGYPEHRLKLRQYLSLYKPPFVCAMFSPWDPKPFFIDIWPLLRRRVAAD